VRRFWRMFAVGAGWGLLFGAVYFCWLLRASGKTVFVPLAVVSFGFALTLFYVAGRGRS